MQSKESLKTVSLGTSKINYLDPRITVAWCKMHEVPIEKIYTRVLLDKFNVRLAYVTALPSAPATDVARTRSGPWRRSPLSTSESEGRATERHNGAPNECITAAHTYKLLARLAFPQRVQARLQVDVKPVPGCKGWLRHAIRGCLHGRALVLSERGIDQLRT